MKIIKTAVVKQVLTGNSKEKLFQSFQSEQSQLQKECEQLRFEMRRSEKSRNVDKGLLLQKFTNEIERRQEKYIVLQNKIEQLEVLPLGSELYEKEVQTIADVDVGDQWEPEIGSTIVIKDGKVVEIRS